MSRRLRKACKQVIEISKQEGMNFSELQKFLRDLNNELKAQKWEDSVNRTEEEKAFKKKADQFFEMINETIKSKGVFGKNGCKEKYAELLTVYFIYRNDIDTERKLLMITAERFHIQTNTMSLYMRDLRKILLEYFEKVSGVEQMDTLHLIKYTMKYVEEYF